MSTYVLDLQHQCNILIHIHLGARALYTTTFGEESLRFLMDNVQCTGRESNLAECNYLGACELRSCSQIEDAGVRCKPSKFQNSDGKGRCANNRYHVILVHSSFSDL